MTNQRGTSSLPPIAVVGVSALFPGSTETGGFWRDILAGRDLITDVPETHWLAEDYYDPDPKAPDKTYAKRGAFLSDVEFDAMAYGIPPTIAPATDTSQLLGLIVAQQVLEDAAQGDFDGLDRSRISVILGVTSAQELLASMVGRLQRPVWVKALRESGLPEERVQEICERMASNYVPWQESTFPGLLGNVVAGRIANRLNLGGTNCVTDAACASAFASVSMAVNELRLGDSDLVIAGGVDTLNDIFMYMCFSKTPALSPTGDCRPFSDQADGTLLGEGLAMVALKRLDDAEKDGDRVYAILRGIGASSDGRAKSVYAPLPEGQARALRRSYAQAGYSPDTVELVEAHGTATKAGDAAEFSGLTQAFTSNGRRQWCALGSVKSQIGHTKAAAGAAGLFKVVMALHNKVLPPTIKIERPNPKLSLEESPFYLNTEARPWIRGSSHPRRGSVSAFGFGGSNFHLTLEEYRGEKQAPRLRTCPSDLVLLGAETPAALAERCREAAQDPQLEWLAYDSQQSFDAGAACRLAIVAENDKDLGAKLLQAAGKMGDQAFAAPSGIYYGHGAGDGDGGQVAFLFSGQGSQYPGMGGDLAMFSDAACAVWDLAADLDFDAAATLSEIVFPRPVFSDEDREAQAERLTETRWAQPAIGAVSLSQLALLEAVGLGPDCVAGHSYGEVSALHAAGVLDAEAMLRVARKRGELMHEAAAGIPGAMTAVVATREEIESRLQGTDVVLANHNSPDQVVLSGSTEAIEAVEKRLGEDGLKVRRLAVGTAFHSPLVAGSSVPFREFLDQLEIAAPRLDAYSNADAVPYPADAEAVRRRLAEQIAQPVRFVDQIEAMYERGVRTFVEVGPGAVLTGLVAKCLRDRPHLAVSLDRKGRSGVTSFWHALGQLAAAGRTFDSKPLWNPFRVPTDPAKVARPKMSLPINGSNYGKLYPPPGGAAALPKPNPPAPEPVVEAAPAAQPAPVPAAQPAPVPAVQPVSVAQPVPVASAAPVDSSWVQAFQEAQRQTVDAHTVFQRSMADTQASFLRTMEASFTGLSQMVYGQGLPAPAMAMAVPQPVALPQQVAVPALQPVAVPVPQPVAAPQPVAVPQPVAAPQPVAVPQPVPAPVAPQPAAPQPAQVSQAVLQELMLDVVADKTGYPVEMLQLDMDLEADLGVDSIKRVEILSAMREREPALPEVDTGKMATLRTLGQIVEYMEAEAGAVAPAVPAAVPATAPTPSSSLPQVELQGLMLDVVADKTGYPAEMLQLDMDLEADLGVDSIKRVEILSAMRERAPELPEVDTGKMATLRTLGQIVEYMEGEAGSAPAVVPAPAAPASAPADAAPVDEERLQGLMLEVVADKTGYPADMLNFGMDLEADLGVDSIKRVEILSAMRERAPELPEVDTGKMATLRTLGQIVDYMGRPETGAPETGAPETGAPETGAPEPRSPEPAALGRFALRQVPAPAAGLAMSGLARGGKIAVTDEGSGVAPALVTALAAMGLDAAVRADVPADAAAVIFLGGLKETADVDEMLTVDRRAFQAARAVAPRFTSAGGVFVTVQDTGGDFGLAGAGERAALGALAGLVKTAGQEWPDAAVKAIDLERGGRGADELAAAIAAEVLAGGPELEVGLAADGTRTTLESYAASLDAADAGSVFDKIDVVVASGGGRGVTAATLIALARKAAPRFVLLGRTALEDEPDACRGIDGEAELKRAFLQAAQADGVALTPRELGTRVSRILAAREIRATMAAMEAAGSEVRYLPADVQDQGALAAGLAEVRRDWGPITGIVHGAGVLADKMIAEKTDEQFDRVFNTKVEGLRALLAATADDPLKAICLFSSVAARCGNQGQCDYAMANEVLNKMAGAERQRRGASCLVKSLGWGPWEGGMVTPALKAHFDAQGVPLIPLDAGARMLVDEFSQASPADQAELVLGGEPKAGPLLAADSGSKAILRMDAHDATIEMDAFVNVHTHAYLEDHSIAGQAVFPVVLVLEWFGRLARIHCPPGGSKGGEDCPCSELTAIRDLQVLRGIQLERFYDGADAFTISSRQLTNGSGCELALELRDREGHPRYRAIVEMSPAHADAPPAVASPPGLEPWPEPAIYGDVLFHGPRFQVIRGLDGISDEGMAGELVGVEAMGWGERWMTDPALLDGGLQLAVLWFKRQLGGASLPMAIGAFHSYASAPVKGPMRTVLKSRVQDSNRIVADLTFSNGSGALIAELRDVQIFRRPDVELVADTAPSAP